MLATELGPPKPQLRDALFANTSEAYLTSLGIRAASRLVLKDAPGFIRMTQKIYENLSPEQQKLLVGYSPSLLPILTHEAFALEKLSHQQERQTRDREANRVRSKEAHRSAFQEGIALRNAAYDALKNAFGGADDRIAQLNELCSPARSPQLLIASLEQIAALIRKCLQQKGSNLPTLLNELRCDESLAQEMLAKAEQIRRLSHEIKSSTGAQRVLQRQVDIQEGRILYLMRMILRAYRAANRRDTSILIPRVVALAKYLASTRVAKAESDEGEGE